MFTGIIGAPGQITATHMVDGDQRLSISSQDLPLDTVVLGDSIAVNGVCLTVVELSNHTFAADVSTETLACTTLSRLQSGTPVNLELALQVGSRLGGHLVSGHVDGVGQLLRCEADARSQRMVFEAPDPLKKFIAAKGSITIEGVSLTVNGVSERQFDVNLIPHTLENTTLKHLSPGDPVNLEVDLIARYVARLHEVETGSTEVDMDLLKSQGYL
jgi:riboflavin synthase